MTIKCLPYALPSPPSPRQLKVTQNLRGCPSKEKLYARLFEVNYHKLYINRKVMNFRFRKNTHFMRGAFLKKEEAGKQNTTECHSAELIAYQAPSLLQKNCPVSISKDQSQKVCQDFADFLLVIFL